MNAKYPAVFATRVLSYPQIKIRERFRLFRYAKIRGRVLRADHFMRESGFGKQRTHLLQAG